MVCLRHRVSVLAQTALQTMDELEESLRRLRVWDRWKIQNNQIRSDPYQASGSVTGLNLLTSRSERDKCHFL
jgi:hypothetical protein